MSDKTDLDDLLERLDGSGSDSEYEAIEQLHKQGHRLPALLLAKYKTTRKWGARSSCVYHAIRYARKSDEAIELGFLALSDKSKVVRYRACMLLAYSLEEGLLERLRLLVDSATLDEETRNDLKAAIDAIEHQNSDFFVDREHSGKVSLRIN